MLDSFVQRRYLIPFRSLLLPQIFTDTLVIGGGVAGLRAAIEAADARGGGGDVIVLLKDSIDVSCTAWAQGGIAAVRDLQDSVDSHVQDTLDAGAGLCIPDVVRTVVEEAPQRVDELIGWGMRFDRDAQGEIHLGREGGHHHHRILHTDGDATGRELARCLHQHLKSLPNVRVFDHCFALDLLTPSGASRRGGGDRVLGAITHHPRYGLQIIWAGSTIIASGGAGQVYRETTNPKVATGDGMAMAWRAGAIIGDAEFMQFHPTTLYIAGAGRALITEAVRGEGAALVNREGRRFMMNHHEMAELAPRDIVSRAIVNELARTQEPCVYLDARELGSEGFRSRFPGLAQLLESFDIDPGSDLIPVRPCAHYTIGGVWSDLDGRTNLTGLFACGEASCSGLHGANRLASNSLLEGLVLGRRAGAAAAHAARDSHRGPLPIVSDIRPSDSGELDLADVRSSLRSAMWRNVGIEKSGSRLDDGIDMIDFWARYTMDKIFDEPDGWETQNLLTVGALMTRAARWRNESRGTHCRLDFPATDPALAAHALWTAGADEPVISSAGQLEVAAR